MLKMQGEGRCDSDGRGEVVMGRGEVVMRGER